MNPVKNSHTICTGRDSSHNSAAVFGTKSNNWWLAAAFVAVAFAGSLNGQALESPAPQQFNVRMDTSRGVIVIEVHRDWAPRGADRFYQLVRTGYYNRVRFHRVVAGKWAQFGINGKPKIAQAWRTRTIPDDPPVGISNQRGTLAFAFAVPNGRTTQVFFNLRDNSATHDKEPFVPFGKIVQGMEVLDALNAEYGEAAGGGIRAGKQGPLFESGNPWLKQNFPRLDYIRRATIVKNK